METIELIDGADFTDVRGTVKFVNGFKLSQIKRFYQIENSRECPLRAWQAHKVEKKWFYAVKGRFEISLVRIMDWTEPGLSTEINTFELSSDKPAVLYVPGGYANSLKSLTNNSILLIYSNLSLEEAKEDQFRFPEETWR